jgi:hypothetical protein
MEWLEQQKQEYSSKYEVFMKEVSMKQYDVSIER